jgi:hypothetical protein
VDHEGIEPTNNTAERAFSVGRDLSQTILRNAERVGQPLHRADADGLGNLPLAKTLDLQLPNSRRRGALYKPACPVTITRLVSGYGSEGGETGKPVFPTPIAATPLSASLKLRIL